VKPSIVFFLFFLQALSCFSQNDLQFPDSSGWNVIQENELLSFKVKAVTADVSLRYSVEGVEGLGINFDSLGNFHWKPAFDLVDRITKSKDYSVIFQATANDGKRIRKSITFTVNHVNRPPVVEELPTFYVRQSTQNNYQFSSDYVYDPDGDPLVFKPILSKMPEGSSLNSQGQITWNASRSQFNSLKNNPIIIEFVVQDQPDKAETTGKLKIAQTQQDLPPEILIVPGDTAFTIKEDETINLKIYISDPNGDDNVRNASFISSDKRVPQNNLKENTQLQYEFTWTPGYDFVSEVQKSSTIDVVFFALDKTNNRAERRIKIKINDAENLIEKDAHQFHKYRNNLIDAMLLIQELDDNQKKLNHDYKKAKRGKKQRSIVNATFGATSGFSPLIFQPNQAKIVGGVGGTTVLTLGTLEAAEVIGKSRQDILDKLKTGIEIRNRIQSAGDEFARRFALKSARRSPDFEKEIDKLRTIMNDQKLVLLELDAEDKGARKAKITGKDLKKVFLDFSEE
jgi:hypothetical protein